MDESRQLVDVDHDPVAQPDGVGRAIDEESTRLAETPERRSQPGHGSRFGRIRPQPSCETRSRLWPITKRYARKHPLLGSRQVKWAAIDHEIEAAEEPEHVARARRRHALPRPFRTHLACHFGEQ
jgi:hypothetical protein